MQRTDLERVQGSIGKIGKEERVDPYEVNEIERSENEERVYKEYIQKFTTSEQDLNNIKEKIRNSRQRTEKPNEEKNPILIDIMLILSSFENWSIFEDIYSNISESLKSLTETIGKEVKILEKEEIHYLCCFFITVFINIAVDQNEKTRKCYNIEGRAVNIIDLIEYFKSKYKNIIFRNKEEIVKWVSWDSDIGSCYKYKIVERTKAPQDARIDCINDNLIKQNSEVCFISFYIKQSNGIDTTLKTYYSHPDNCIIIKIIMSLFSYPNCMVSKLEKFLNEKSIDVEGQWNLVQTFILNRDVFVDLITDLIIINHAYTNSIKVHSVK